MPVRFSRKSLLADESSRHIQSLRRHITNCRLHIIGNELDEVAGELVLHGQHLFVHFSHRALASEHDSTREVLATPRITGHHHVLGIEQLGGEVAH